MCFIDQRYARGLTEGAMLGYVFDGEIEKARDSIAASIAANPKKLRCAAPFCLVPSRIETGHTSVGETSHSIPQGLFTIYHLFVAV